MTDRPEATQTPAKGLQPGSIGLVGSIVVSLASTAPAYSLAASLGLVVANRVDPDCGTTFTGVTRAFGPVPGWLGGWGIIAADVIVMANLAQVAGSYGYTFVGTLVDDDAITALAHDTLWSTVAGVAWIAVMTLVCHLGIEVSTRLQYALLSI